ncbi:MAG TPA: hydrogenase formation protein HypD [Candidatus Moranbacteria bacterium]|nr:hydrogenase formation protein HypD [Candidatus Moranbacteria bacterium]
MKYKKILKNIQEKAKIIRRPIRLMELCGTHSETIAKYGIKNILPKNIKMISGPGCPVCVADQSDVDIITGLALSGIPIACYGDSANIPGNLGSLENARQQGAEIYIVYDISEALKISKKNPDLIFWGIGFETTAPMTAWGIQNGLKVFSSHKIFPPAMRALLRNNKIKIDGFINPGHVSVIIGAEIYKKFKIPQVVAGFSATDVIKAIDMLLDQITKKEKKVENEYARLVQKEGNKKAQKLISKVFEAKNARWRGLGEIKNSGLKIKKKYKNQDAEFIHRELIAKIKKNIKNKPSVCHCGEVLQGIIEPKNCPLFRKVCTPDNPQGACMVSREGSCNVEYRYG